MSSADAPSAAVRTMIPPPFGSSRFTMSFKPRALGVLEPPRDAGALAVRDVDEEAAGERDLGREPRALRLHRILDRLHHDRLAALDQILDLPRALPPLELGPDDLVDVEESVLLEADLDERGLHPGQHVVDDAEVDVPGDRASLRALEIDLGDTVVLEDRDSLLADVDGDDELALRRRQRRALRRCAPAVAAARLLPIRLGVGLARLPGSRRRSLRADGSAALRRVVGVGISVVRGRRDRLLSVPCRRDSRDDVSSSALSTSSARPWARLPPALPAEPQAVLPPPELRSLARHPLPAACQSETSVVPRLNSPRVFARGPRSATGWTGLALRGFKTLVDMTCRQATSRSLAARDSRRAHAAAGRRRARRARTARRRCDRRAQAHGSSSE